jgi:hypothetical protein
MTGDTKVHQLYNKMSYNQRSALVKSVMEDLVNVGVSPDIVRQVNVKIAIAYVLLAYKQSQPRDFPTWFTSWWIELSKWAYANGYERVLDQPIEEDNE